MAGDEIKRALVSGGNRGIGLEIAKGLISRGIDVVIGSRIIADGKKAVAGTGIGCVELDVADQKSIESAASAAGPFDILVNNAGVLLHKPMLEDPDGYQTSMAVMVDGPYHLIRACQSHMRATNYGRIVNLSSEWGAFSDGMHGPGAYGVAKAALNALTLALSQQLPSNIKINAMCPGWVRTRMGGSGASRTVEEGADTAIWLATLSESGPTGGFFRDRKPIGW